MTHFELINRRIRLHRATNTKDQIAILPAAHNRYDYRFRAQHSNETLPLSEKGNGAERTNGGEQLLNVGKLKRIYITDTCDAPEIEGHSERDTLKVSRRK